MELSNGSTKTESGAAMLAAVMMALVLQEKSERIIGLIVHGITEHDDEVTKVATTIFAEMNEEERASAYLYAIAMQECLTSGVKKHEEYYSLGIDSPPKTGDEDRIRANENLAGLISSAKPATDRLGITA